MEDRQRLKCGGEQGTCRRGRGRYREREADAVHNYESKTKTRPNTKEGQQARRNAEGAEKARNGYPAPHTTQVKPRYRGL